MNRKHIWIWVLCLSLGQMACTDDYQKDQSYEPFSYHIEGDEVVFEFDKEAYEQASLDGTPVTEDFDDINIYEICVSGEFNDWSKDGWRMRRVSENRYQLRKKIVEFQDKMEWQFKFIVNGNYWAEPPKDAVNVVSAGHEYGRAKNLVLNIMQTDPNGNVLFSLADYEEAKRVVVSGSFNNWHTDALHMHKAKGGWECRIQLPPGRYEYKFIVDDIWIHDEKNSDRIPDGYYGYNSILYVPTSDYEEY